MFLHRFVYQRAEKIVREIPQLQTRRVATAWCMSSYIHPRSPIRGYTRISQRGTILRVWFWFGRAIGSCRGVGWNHQCIISSMEISLMLIYFPRIFTFMWWRRRQRSVFLSCRSASLRELCHATDAWHRGREQNQRERRRR